jgi:hypothetical protein
MPVAPAVGRIMERFPPEKYHYLGLGKSPTPVIAFLQAYGERIDPLDPIEASNMPLSKFSPVTSGMSSDQRKYVGGGELDAEQRGRLWDHFDAFVPHGPDSSGKAILLIDHVQTGKSLFATQKHLQDYLYARYAGSGATGLLFSVLGALGCVPSAPAVETLPLAIAEEQDPKGGNKKTMDALGLSARAEMLPGKLEAPDSPEALSSLATLMGGEHFKPAAEYPADFKITAEDKPRTESNVRDPRGLYEQLKGQIRTFIANDGELVGLMQGEAQLDAVEEKAPLLAGIIIDSDEDEL